MRKYSDYRPSAYDVNIPIEERGDWLVLLGRNRDSCIADESNFDIALMLLEAGSADTDYEVVRQRHWACGCLDIILVRPGTKAAQIAEELEGRLADYPLLDDDDFAEREMAAADETWRTCFTQAQRLEFIRKRRASFDFYDFRVMLRVARGEYFTGCAADIL